MCCYQTTDNSQSIRDSRVNMKTLRHTTKIALQMIRVHSAGRVGVCCRWVNLPKMQSKQNNSTKNKNVHLHLMLTLIAGRVQQICIFCVFCHRFIAIYCARRRWSTGTTCVKVAVHLLHQTHLSLQRNVGGVASQIQRRWSRIVFKPKSTINIYVVCKCLLLKLHTSHLMRRIVSVVMALRLSTRDFTPPAIYLVSY